LGGGGQRLKAPRRNRRNRCRMLGKRRS
jgi:hypothetical protein